MSEARSSRSNNRNRSSNDGSDVREQAGSLGSDPDVVDRHRKIEAEGEPVSIPESLNPNDVTPPEGKLKQPAEIDVGNAMLLQRMPIDELVEQAAKEGVEQPEDLRRNELVFQVLKQRVKNCGIIWGEGTLQILPDGFGFFGVQNFITLVVPTTFTFRPAKFENSTFATDRLFAVRSVLPNRTSATSRCYEWSQSTGVIPTRHLGKRCLMS